MNIYKSLRPMLKVNYQKGRMLALASSLVLVFALGLGTILAQKNPVGEDSPTQEPWQSTLTAIMITRTANAKLYPSPTVTPMTSAVATQSVLQKTFEPLELTATFIVGEATDTAAIELTDTAVAIFGFTITTGTLMPTVNPTPTYTVAELSQQKKSYLNKLVTTVGFNHPVFEDIANNLLVEEVLASRYLPLSDLELDTQSISFADSKYVVLVVHRVGWDTAFNRILLFRVSKQEPILLDDPSTVSSDLFLYIGLGHFADLNGNGFPDITVYTSYGGNCCLPQLHILEIKPNYEIADISPETTDVYPARLIDLNDDGVPEIEGQSRGGGLSSTIWLIRWFGWNGQAYVDISRQHPELYLTTINIMAQEIVSPAKCHGGLFAIEMENYLVNFYAMGRLVDGWRELQRLLKLQCSPTDLQKEEKTLKEVEQWMNSLPKS